MSETDIDKLCGEYREILIRQITTATVAAQTEIVGRNWLQAAFNEALVEFVRLMDQRNAAIAEARAAVMDALGKLLPDASRVAESAEYPEIIGELAKVGVTKENFESILNADAEPEKTDWAKAFASIDAEMDRLRGRTGQKEN